MKTLRLITVIVLVTVMILALPGVGEAATNTFTPANGYGDYSDSNRWSLGHVPVDGEDIVISGNNAICYVDIETESLNSVTVESGMIFDIQDSVFVNVDASDGTSTIDGTVYLNDFSIIFLTGDHVLNGSGMLVGNNDSSLIYLYTSP